MRLRTIGRVAASMAGFALLAAPAAAQSFMDVGKQAPITILINSSPWYAGFEKVVDLYEKQTGNKVNLEVTPFDGMIEKARTAVRTSGKSPLDLLNINSLSAVEFYQGGFLQPLKEIDPTFELPKEVLTLDDAGCWDEAKKYRICSSGKLMGYTPNGNVPLFYYREDTFKAKNLKVPTTYDEVLENCKSLQDPPRTYGYVQRGEKGDGIQYDFSPYLISFGASAEKDPANGDFTVTANSPEMKAALDKFIEVARKCGPENYGSLGQGELIQLWQTGKAQQGHAVVAAFPNFDNAQKSAVVGKINAALMPAARPGGKPGVAIGSWVFGIPKNASEEGKKGAIAFSKWFLTYKAQYAYAEAGGIPVRTDIFTSDLKDKPKFRWMKAYLEQLPYGRQLWGYSEGQSVTQAFGLRLNQALVGQLSSGAALNRLADDLEDIFKRGGRKTGRIAPLPE